MSAGMYQMSTAPDARAHASPIAACSLTRSGGASLSSRVHNTFVALHSPRAVPPRDELGPGEVRTVGGRGHSLTGRCTAVVRSGIPPSNPLYTVRVQRGVRDEHRRWTNLSAACVVACVQDRVPWCAAEIAQRPAVRGRD